MAFSPPILGCILPNLWRRQNWYEGFDYLQQWRNSWSDTRDGLLLSARYLPEFGNNDQITLADDGFLMVYDVKHVATGKATYMSINVYSGLVGKLSIGSVYHDRFSDTATPYLPARSCGEFDVRL